MANIANLQEKVQKATEKVEKCKGTIARHEKQLVKKNEKVLKQGITLDLSSEQKVEDVQMKHRQSPLYWDISDVKGKLDDIEGAKKKLANAERILNENQEKLNIELERERFLNNEAPQVIKDFLQKWKELATEWHIKRYNDYQDFKPSLEEQRDIEIIEFIKLNAELFSQYLNDDGEVKEYWLKDIINIRGKGLEDNLRSKKLDYRSIEDRKRSFAGMVVLDMDRFRDEKNRLEYLEKVLEEDRRAKMLDLINRINKVVGTITDASALTISAKGNLDGIIVGEKASAKVETIGAGGYNVQCFHYRTLVHKL